VPKLIQRLRVSYREAVEPQSPGLARESAATLGSFVHPDATPTTGLRSLTVDLTRAGGTASRLWSLVAPLSSFKLMN